MISLPFHVCHRRSARIKTPAGAPLFRCWRLCSARWNEKDARFDLEVTARLKISYFVFEEPGVWYFRLRTGTPGGGVRSKHYVVKLMHWTFKYWLMLVNWVSVDVCLRPGRYPGGFPVGPYMAFGAGDIHIRPEPGEVYGLEINGTFPELCTDIKVGVREFPRVE